MEKPGGILAPGFFLQQRPCAEGLGQDVPVFHKTVTALVRGDPWQQG